jgi:AcrR family transcriptional regulator
MNCSDRSIQEVASMSSVREEQKDPAPDRRVTARGALSRDRIIEATLALLGEGGYAALSISAICKRADVSPASLYHHFGDKAGLVTAVIEESVRAGARLFVTETSRRDGPLAQLDAFLEVTREIQRNPTNPITVLLKAAEALCDAPEIAQAMIETRGRVWRFVAAEFADRLGIEDGMLFAHLQAAFMSYIAHLAHASHTEDGAAEAVFQTYRRVLLITAAAVRPDFLKDPAFAAAVAEASHPCPIPPRPLENEL